MQLSKEVRRAVDQVIRDRFKGKVEKVEIEFAASETGEEAIIIHIIMSKDTTAEDFSGRFFGLTGLVRKALGSEMQGVFPIIRPVEAHA